jgi:hypothetical protein
MIMLCGAPTYVKLGLVCFTFDLGMLKLAHCWRSHWLLVSLALLSRSPAKRAHTSMGAIIHILNYLPFHTVNFYLLA